MCFTTGFNGGGNLVLDVLQKFLMSLDTQEMVVLKCTVSLNDNRITCFSSE